MSAMREKREAKGYTQQRLAEAVGVTQTAISLIESGERIPSVTLARKIAEILGIRWTELYEEQEVS